MRFRTRPIDSVIAMGIAASVIAMGFSPEAIQKETQAARKLRLDRQGSLGASR
jgi:hypothetical protein